MAIQTIPILDANGVIWHVLVDTDGAGNYAQVLKIGFSADDLAPTLASAANPLPVTDVGLASSLASQTTAAAILAKLSADPATQTTLAALLVELGQKLEPADLATLSTAAKQDLAKTALDLLHTDLGGTLKTLKVPLTSATPVQIASSATVVTLQALNTARRQLILTNDSTAVLYLKYGSAATATSYTYKIPAGGVWEMPLPVYTGTVTGIWAAANGFAYVTEGV